MKTRVLLIGSTGLLGSEVLKEFSEDKNFELNATYRQRLPRLSMSNVSNVKFLQYDSSAKSLSNHNINLSSFDFVVNCIGAIKQKLYSENDMYSMNTVLPRYLARELQESTTQLINITSDCVFSGGIQSAKTEDFHHDAKDTYGLSKSLGEVNQSNVINLRTSFIGLENGTNYSLLSWFLSKPQQTHLNGYVNHFWNGITTLHYAKIIRQLVYINTENLPRTLHIVPRDFVSKYDLLKMFAKYFNREDLAISPHTAGPSVYRILSTIHHDLNVKLWTSIGYHEVTTIEQLIKDFRKANE